MKCETCNGTGNEFDGDIFNIIWEEYKKCSTCNGTGKITMNKINPYQMDDVKRCPIP